MRKVSIILLLALLSLSAWAYSYKTPDLRMLQVKGNVKYIMFTKDCPASGFKSAYCYFDRNGWIDVNKTFYSKTTVKRNGSWQLVAIEREYEAFVDGFDMPLGYYSEWSYNSSGFVTKIANSEWEWANTDIYIYDSNDVLIEKRTEWDSNGDSGYDIYTYSSYKYDSRGNWISRYVTVRRKSYDIEGDFSTTSESYVEKRVIAYYD